MTSKLLVIPGHLGKDTGAVSKLHEEGETPSLAPQQERWANLQQAIGFMIAYSQSQYRKELHCELVVPNGEVEGMIFPVRNMKDDHFSIGDRIRLVNEENADLVEIHNNSASFKAHGAEVLCFSKATRSGDISHGYKAGMSILKALEEVSIRNRGVKPVYDYGERRWIGRKLPILYKTRNVAIITEAGFLSDRRDFKGLDVDLDGYNDQVGAVIFRGYLDTWLKLRQH